MDTFVNFNIFKLIETLNTDIIECIHLEPHSGNLDTRKICMVLKPFGKEFGLSQKYILSTTTKIQSNQNVQFISNPLDELGTIQLVVDAEPVHFSANLNIDIVSRFHLDETYTFNLELDTELPIYMEKLPGQFIQKIFIRLKTYMESLP